MRIAGFALGTLAFLSAFCQEGWDALPAPWGKLVKAAGLGALAVKLLYTDPKPKDETQEVKVVNPPTDPANVAEVPA